MIIERDSSGIQKGFSFLLVASLGIAIDILSFVGISILMCLNRARYLLKKNGIKSIIASLDFIPHARE